MCRVGQFRFNTPYISATWQLACVASTSHSCLCARADSVFMDTSVGLCAHAGAAPPAAGGPRSFFSAMRPPMAAGYRPPAAAPMGGYGGRNKGKASSQDDRLLAYRCKKEKEKLRKR
eukprot:1128962-Pelagomonas_calceolata.AAC.3